MQNYPQQSNPQQNPQQNSPQQIPQQNYPQQNPQQSNLQQNPQQSYPQQSNPQQNYPQQSYPQQNNPQQIPQQNPQKYPQQMQGTQNYPPPQGPTNAQPYGEQFATNQYQPPFPQSQYGSTPQGYPPPQSYTQYPQQSGGFSNQPQISQQGGYTQNFQGSPHSGGYPNQGNYQGQNVQFSGPSWLQQGGSQIPQSKMMDWFRAADVNGNGRISAEELQRALTLSGEEYSIGTVHKMMDMFDVDANGAIDFAEFSALYSFLNQMKHSYQQYQSQGGISYDQVPVALATHRGLSENIGGMSGIMTSMYPIFDPSGSGKLDFNHFIKMALSVGKAQTGYGKQSMQHPQQHMQSYPQQGFDITYFGNQVLSSLMGKPKKKQTYYQ